MHCQFVDKGGSVVLGWGGADQGEKRCCPVGVLVSREVCAVQGVVVLSWGAVQVGWCCGGGWCCCPGSVVLSRGWGVVHNRK